MFFCKKESNSQPYIAFDCHNTLISFTGSSSKFPLILTFIILKIIGNFVGYTSICFFLMWSHENFRLWIFGRTITEVKLYSSHCILSGGTQFQSVSVQMVFTLTVQLGWCLWGFSAESYSLLSSVTNNYFVERHLEYM